MRKTFLLLLATGLLAVPLAAAPGAQAQRDDLSSVPRISQADFKKLLATGHVVVIDNRDEGSYKNGHIPGSICIPLSDIEKHVGELEKERRPIVTYCA